MGFILNHLPPADLTTNLAFTNLCFGVPAESVSSLNLAWAFVAHAIKWPTAVQFFEELIRERRPATASDVVATVIAVIRWSSGKTWPAMFESINGRRMAATTGLAVLGGQLGLLLPAPSPGKRVKGRVYLGPVGKATMPLGGCVHAHPLAVVSPLSPWPPLLIVNGGLALVDSHW